MNIVCFHTVCKTMTETAAFLTCLFVPLVHLLCHCLTVRPSKLLPVKEMPWCHTKLGLQNTLPNWSFCLLIWEAVWGFPMRFFPILLKLQVFFFLCCQRTTTLERPGPPDEHENWLLLQITATIAALHTTMSDATCSQLERQAMSTVHSISPIALPHCLAAELDATTRLQFNMLRNNKLVRGARRVRTL